MADIVVVAPTPVRARMSVTRAWVTVGALATGAGTATAPSNDLVNYALISIGGGAVVAILGPVATAWARTLFHRKNYRTEQQALNDHLIEEMERLARDNEKLREENAELRHRRR